MSERRMGRLVPTRRRSRVILILLHEHDHARKAANRGGAVAGNLSQDRRDPTRHLAAPVALDEEPEIIDDLQLWPALAALQALRVQHGVVQRNDANARADGKGAALHTVTERVPMGV